MLCPNREKENRSAAALCGSCGTSLRESSPENRPENPEDQGDLSWNDALPATAYPTGEDTAGADHIGEPASDEVFVGRREELGELLAALEDARSGRGRLVMASGELGVGKSRTSQGLAARAR